MKSPLALITSLLAATSVFLPILSQAQPKSRPLDLATAGCVAPAIPPEAAKAGVAGEARISFTVDASGSVMNATVSKSSGPTPAHKQLDEAALQSVRTCHFTPVKGYGPAKATQGFNFGIEPAKQLPPRPVDSASATCDPVVRPPASNEAGATGDTRVTYTVDASGSVSDVAIAESSGDTPAHKLLDEAAVTAVKSCKYAAVAASEFGPAKVRRGFRWNRAEPTAPQPAPAASQAK